ncbi:MAG: ATP-binding protein, partial [Myxococcota bacterium]
EAPAVLSKAPDADPALAELCDRLLKKEPGERVQSADEALALLVNETEGFGDTTDSDHHRTVSSPDEPSSEASLPDETAAAQTALDRAIQRTSDGRGAVVLVDGVTGFGKSLMLRDLRRRHRNQVTMVMGTCHEHDITPYRPIRSLLDEIASILVKSPPEITRKIVGRDGGLVRALSSRLADLAPPVTVDHLDTEERRVRLHKAIIGVVGRLALTRPLLLIIEDFPWADTASCEVLRDAARTFLQDRKDGQSGSVCPVSFVLTQRTSRMEGGAGQDLLERLGEQTTVENIRLSPVHSLELPAVSRSLTGLSGIGLDTRRASSSLH